ncbi:MAG: hypothetical protein IJ512_05875 [Ruminococcus sp.]|nr:hypothetical protein [Ruminococcus sp.]
MNNSLTLNRNQLKYLVIAAMLIDHIAWAFVPTDSVLGQVMHFIGRLTGPTMAYFIAEGYYYTRNFRKYALRLGIFAFLSWLPFVYFEFGTMPVYLSSHINGEQQLEFNLHFGVLYTLLLGLLAIKLWDSKLDIAYKILTIAALCILSLFGDWAIFDVLWCLFFHIWRKDSTGKWTSYCCVAGSYIAFLVIGSGSWLGSLWGFGVFLVPLLLHFCYSGKPGCRHPINKWFFYIFYPAHLAVLGILRWMLFPECC